MEKHSNMQRRLLHPLRRYNTYSRDNGYEVMTQKTVQNHPM